MEVNLVPQNLCSGVQAASHPRPVRLPLDIPWVRSGLAKAVLVSGSPGVLMHETHGLAGAADALPAAGSKAMHSVLTRCRRANLTQ